MESNRFYGKYRGEVTDNADPKQLCRIRAKVPSILNDNDSGWALPCLPCTDKNAAGKFIPQVGSLVWIEFESGDPNRPIWAGCFYS
jgi:uncharacterized protein involved in type VI secretion and phage assembly